jgi:hypothetical protein
VVTREAVRWRSIPLGATFGLRVRLTFSRTLCVGSAGTAVASFQQFLTDDGDTTLAVASYFGATDARFAHPVSELAKSDTDRLHAPVTRARINTIEAQHPG